jgi:hypothetical protein
VLSGIGGETDAECGSFWSKLKGFASSAANKAAPLTALAPLFGPAAAIAVPVASHMLKKKPSQAPAPAQNEENLMEVVGYGPERQMVEDYTYIFGGEIVTGAELMGGSEDDMIIGEGGGASELAAFQRRRRRPSRTFGFQPEPEARSSSMGAVPHDVYRTAIFRRAQKIGGTNPTAKQISQAQASVDVDLRKNNLFVAIPGGRPGRVTR